MTGAALSLTQQEAEQRAALLEVSRYDIAVDLTDLAEGTDVRCVSTIAFGCREPGASTFLDCCADVVTATLNGEPVAPADSGRIALPDLRADNVVVVESVQPRTTDGEGVHKSVDPTDGEVYVWMSFEPDEARQVWACFDQPDLKAPHAFTVTAPSAWTVVSNSGDVAVHEVEGARRWDVPGHTAPLDVQPGRPGRPVPRDPAHGRWPRPRALRPPVAGRGARPRRRGAVHRDGSGDGLLRRGLRDALPAGEVRPGVRARARWRDGELRLRDVVRRLPHPGAARPRPSRSSSLPCCCTRWRTCGSATSSRCAGGTTSGSTRRSPSSPPTGRCRRPPASPTPGPVTSPTTSSRPTSPTWDLVRTRSASPCPTWRRRPRRSTRSPTPRAPRSSNS